jgi:DNA-binding protein H-NS
MSTFELGDLSVKDLMILRDEVDAAIVARKDQERAEIREKLAALAEKSGFELEELFGKRRKNGAARGKVAPKYRNPADPTDTWTGRGRMPPWMKALTDKGAKREKYLIK